MINWKFPYMSKEWSTLRDKHLNSQPYCVKCQTTLQLQVDHIIEHGNNQTYFLNSENLQTLCIKCHGQKTFRTQKLRKLRVDNSKKIKLVFNSTRGLRVSDNILFKNAYTNFYQVGNVVFFYFAQPFESYSIKELALIVEFLCDFFWFVKWITPNIDNKVLANDIATKLEL
ncbi:HNH endonuclease [Mycoplasma sp. AA7A]|uniref:HNH endonuclease n=1 Tax=Mycoplasma sp. AA7A TaxID=3401665 RepID=UPI003AAD91B5